MPSKALILTLIANMILSGAANAAARQWVASDLTRWLIIALAINLPCSLSMAWVIRLNGLGAGSTIALLTSVVVNVAIGIYVFEEKLAPLQLAGLCLGVIGLALLLWRPVGS